MLSPLTNEYGTEAQLIDKQLTDNIWFCDRCDVVRSVVTPLLCCNNENVLLRNYPIYSQCIVVFIWCRFWFFESGMVHNVFVSFTSVFCFAFSRRHYAYILHLVNFCHSLSSISAKASMLLCAWYIYITFPMKAHLFSLNIVNSH